MSLSKASLLLAVAATAEAFAPGAVLPSNGRAVVAQSQGITMQRLGSSRGSGAPPPAGGGSPAPRAPSQGSAPSAPAGGQGSIGDAAAGLAGGFAGRLGSLFGGSQAPSSPAPPAKAAPRAVGLGTQPAFGGGRLGSSGGSQMVTPKKAAPAPKKAAPKAAPAPKFTPPPAARANVPAFTQTSGVFGESGFNGQGRFQFQTGNKWDDEGADWARGGGIFATGGGVTWAREAEVKHGRICMLAATGAIVQDLYTFPFMDKWYNGEKMWGLHEAAIKSGAMWQVLFFVGLLELGFLIKLVEGTLDGSGDVGFDPAGLKENPTEYAMNQVREVKNGRLAMIAISGMTHHYFLTGKGPIEFITQIPNFKSCSAAAVATTLCR